MVTSREEDERAAQLRVMKRRATGLLVLVALCFVGLTTLAADEGGWAGYARAAIEGAMVGGLADWFAVTALFRHPLGIPIPHTAIIRERKNQFGATLGSFVQENFLSSAVIGERARAARIPPRLARWMCDPDNAERAARYASETLVGLADVVRDEDVNRLLSEELERAVQAIPVAPLAGRVLEFLTQEGRHDEVLDAMLGGASRFLDENRDDLRRRFERESPWWLPGAVEDRIFERLLDGARALLSAVVADPEHELRALFDQKLADLATRLQTDESLRRRGEEIKRDLLDHPALRAWVGGLWGDAKELLRAKASSAGSPLRMRLAEGVRAAGARLDDDPALQEKLERFIESAISYLAETYRDEISGLITGTIARWDPEETSRKLELLLGRDLQFIRINGTVVGGLAGTLIYAVGEAVS
ncbi:MAG TPA: DUF445 domain-containing protein [Acidimicrobiales bacterium]|nr:DUF445 domain-containing protein [Acidimicrobiales bacterium]